VPKETGTKRTEPATYNSGAILQLNLRDAMPYSLRGFSSGLLLYMVAFPEEKYLTTCPSEKSFSAASLGPPIVTRH